ncbi:hypothetical protein LEN26_012567 [Aphanomyces euteiches]|nr:hypothetical protein LEN26_012567 [Aphanomyces euteiches]
MASWEEIASALKIMPGFQLKTKTGPVLKSRFEAIMTRFSQGEVESMRKSGSNEDYQERQQLMTDIQSRIEDYAQVKEVRRDAEKRKSEGIENSGTLIRKLAMAELASSKESDQSDSPCNKKKKVSPLKSKALHDLVESIQHGIAEQRARAEIVTEKAAEIQRERLEFDKVQAEIQQKQF